MRADDLLARYNLTGAAPAAASDARFPDGAHYRVEIPSVEGPAVLKATIEEAAAAGITVNRVSQGSGAMVHTLAELREMSRIAADAGIEVSLFVGPKEGYDVGSQARAADGAALASQSRGIRQLRYGIEDVLRALEQGIRGFLVADLGLLEVLVDLQRAGEIPASVVWKVSVMLAPSNPIAFAQIARLGGSTINVPSDMNVDQLAELRAAAPQVPIDLYVEAPDALGGQLRIEQTADLITAAAPIYVKFGLRNAKMIYPAGIHLEADAIAIARTKVRRAQAALEWVQRLSPGLIQSAPGAAGLGVPEL